jgi:hypothetical protein
MRCEAAERELSALLDGESVDRDVLREHVESCPRCRAFEARARRLRELVRLEPAAPVPDLVPRIMDQVRRRPVPARAPAPAWLGHAAAFVAGAVAAALLTGGLPALRGGPEAALATEIPRRVVAAAAEVTSYRAAFAITERNFHPRVERRTFTARVAFVAPERFRARIADTTAYPSASWPRNDLTLAVDRDRWLLRQPVTCPREALPACDFGGVRFGAVEGREPFDDDAPLPTDIVLPVRTLSGTERVRVVGETTAMGREAVVIELAYRDAIPLFEYLHAGGSWRPLYPHDRVLVTLDRETWFPLAYEVYPVGGLERDRWAVRNGLPVERPGVPVLVVRARSFREGPVSVPRIPELPGASDEGFRDRPMASIAAAAGWDPVLPAELGGLVPYRAGMYADRPSDEVLLSFTRGLTWLKVRETTSWNEPAVYGDVGELAQEVALPGGGVGYYEPATAELGRRLSLHSQGVDLYLESNLPRRELLSVAASVPVRGRRVPDRWLSLRLPGGAVQERVGLEEAAGAAPFVLLPSTLPQDYRPAAAFVLRAEGRTEVTVYFRRPGAELDGVGIRLHQASGVGLPPPTDPDTLAVRVRGTTGRYSPSRGELEWLEGDIYRSLSGMSLDLGGLLAVSRSLEPAR